MPQTLTKRLIDAAKPQARDSFLWDADAKGFGLKVTPAGRKVFVLQYRKPPGGRGMPLRRFTIGSYGSPWTLDSARKEAQRLLSRVHAGNDPAAEKREEKEGRGALTFASLVERFIADKERSLRPRSLKELRQNLLRDAVPAWGKRHPSEIERRDAIDLLDSIVGRGSPISANRTRAALSNLFAWAATRDLVPASPVLGLGKPAPERSRERVLADDELRDIWEAAEADDYPFGPAVRLLMLTAQRRTETGAMRGSDLDLAAKVWTIPGERAKNARPHLVPLSEPTLALLESLPVGEGFVFTTNGKAPFQGWSRAKARLDARIAAAREERGAEPMQPWTLHDIRRSVTTGLAELGVAPHVADRILNHVGGTVTGVAAVYNRAEYMQERRAALEAWGRRLDAILGRGDDNIIALSEHRPGTQEGP